MGRDETIGFIGLGAMGRPMALNLIGAGRSLIVWNRSAEKCAPLRAAGAEVAPDAETVFARAGSVLLMLSDEGAIDAVLARGETGGTGFAARVRGRLVVQTGTVAPGWSQALEADIRAAGGRYVEAPVSGSRKPAEAGALVAMLAGAPEAAAAAEALLAPLCARTVRCGPVPGALRMKLASNALLLPMIAALAEAFHLADRFGLDRRLFAEVIGGGQLASPIARVKAEKLAAGDLTLQAAVSDALKNTRLAVEAARGAGAASPLLDAAQALYAETQALGLGGADIVAVLRAIEARTDAAEAAGTAPGSG